MGIIGTGDDGGKAAVEAHHAAHPFPQPGDGRHVVRSQGPRGKGMIEATVDHLGGKRIIVLHQAPAITAKNMMPRFNVLGNPGFLDLVDRSPMPGIQWLDTDQPNGCRHGRTVIPGDLDIEFDETQPFGQFDHEAEQRADAEIDQTAHFFLALHMSDIVFTGLAGDALHAGVVGNVHISARGVDMLPNDAIGHTQGIDDVFQFGMAGGLVQ